MYVHANPRIVCGVCAACGRARGSARGRARARVSVSVSVCLVQQEEIVLSG